MGLRRGRVHTRGLRRHTKLQCILGNPGKKRSTRTRRRTSANSTLTDAVTELAGRAAETLETRATTSGFGTRTARGKLIVECADVADLRRIVEDDIRAKTVK